MNFEDGGTLFGDPIVRTEHSPSTREIRFTNSRGQQKVFTEEQLSQMYSGKHL